MKVLIEKGKIINDMIPQVITNSNLYRKEIKKRIRLNDIFSEFENKAYNDLNHYIEQSNQRYNKLKSGTNLKALISTTRKKNLNESMKILNDKFYTSNNIIGEERNKMLYKNTDKFYKKLKNSMKTIKNPEIKKKELKIKDLNDDELQVYENMNINEKDLDEYIKRYNSIDYNDDNPLNSLYGKDSNSGISFRGQNLNNDKNAISEVINDENKTIFNSIDNYKTTLIKLKKKYDEAKKVSIDKEPRLNIHKKINFNFPKIKLLNYAHYDLSPKIEKNNDEIYKVNMEKLLPFSKYGKYSYSVEKNDSCNNTENREKNDKTLPYITEPNLPNNNYYYKNYQNTIYVVHNTAKKEIFTKKNFNKKMDDIESILGVDDIPDLKSYDYIARKKTNSIAQERKKKNDKISERQNYLKLTEIQRRNVDISKNIQFLDNVSNNLYRYDIKNTNKNK